MKSNYKQLGQFIRQVDVRNTDGKEDNLLGVSVQKKFIPSIANTVGTDFRKYKIVKRGQFTYIPDTSRRGDKIAIALLLDYEEGIVSNVYTVFEVIDENQLLSEYLMLWFMRPEFDRYARFKSHGSVREVMDWDEMCKVELPVPEIEKQRQIVKAYNTINDRIALKRKINDNLEQQAQAILKSWFVDFEPFDGVMPDDWRIGTLSEICGYSKDKVDIDSLTLDSYYSTENMQSNRQGAVQATTLPTIKQTTACKKGDVLISNIRPYFKKILYCFADCGCSTDVLCFVPNKNKYSAFLYCALFADKFFDYMVAGSKGTKMPRGDKQQIMAYPICIPSAEYIEKFNQAVAPMLETVYTNRIEANNLANIRDTLLPKLMSGEIDVSEIQI